MVHENLDLDSEHKSETSLSIGSISIKSTCGQAQTIHPWRTRPCNLDNITAALSDGLDPNIQWTESDLVEPHPRSGCFTHTRGLDYIPWAHWNTPLHKALKEGHLDAAALLFDRGAGRTAAHVAVHAEDEETISFLARCGADLNCPSEKRTARDAGWDEDVVGVAGLLPVHHAIHIGSPKMIQALVEHGADVDLPTTDGWAPLDLALLERRDDVVKVLLRAGAWWSSDAVAAGALPSGFNAEESAEERAARELLAFATSGIHEAGNSGRGHFPPSSCRGIYSRVLSTLGLLQMQNDLGRYSDKESPSLTLPFFDALFKAANLHVAVNPAHDDDG